MSTGKSIPVWFTDEDRRRVEEAAALAGYKHLSKYIRDKALDRGGQREATRDSMEAWAERQELIGRLAEIERSQKTAHALLAMLLFLMRKKATTGEFNELVLACEKAGVPAELLAASFPELASLIARFTEDS
ncbi:conjugal transfer protein TraA [Ralstonia solanacearum]|uniref:conjugal transfer protein TraA n=1 Tax=Burkholderiaceae TaxID=119060 RepID=UPI000C9FBD21|nr:MULTISPECIES: conjugal transfer protein TraA [Burkholderiaceae]AUS41344.1 conjugal transfer protein TraA [Ralstonia solanacearum]KAF3458064.1 TraA protein [Ralstonia solanacearum]NKA81535.1 type IV secretion system [Ralstonia solanacearum]NKG02249.1 type IV secretion system [Ralstonia solanacearum]UNJ33189.1 conjugal transfer protein TraA [Ralstonia pseudosolanacearum]